MINWSIKTMQASMNLRMIATVALLVCLGGMTTAALEAQSSGAEDTQGFVDSIAAGIFIAAWPTATYKKASIKSSDWVEGGLDVKVRFFGESAFGGELWLDMVLEFRDGGLSDMRLDRHNAILVPPFETAKALGTIVEELLKDLESNGSSQVPAPATVAPLHSAQSAGAVCLKNPTPYKLNYYYRWGEQEWETDSLESKTNGWYWWPYSGGESVSPKFSIRFDDNFAEGFTETSYWLPRASATLPITCEKAMQFEFVVHSESIDLKRISN